MKERSLIGLLLFCFLSIAVISEASDLFGTIQFKGKPLPDAEITLTGRGQEQHAKTNFRMVMPTSNIKLS